MKWWGNFCRKFIFFLTISVIYLASVARSQAYAQEGLQTAFDDVIGSQDSPGIKRGSGKTLGAALSPADRNDSLPSNSRKSRQILLVPSSLSFGNVAIGSTSALPVTATNTGTSSVQITGSNVTGAGFSVVGISFPVTLAPGQSISFSVSFAPTTAGNATGQLALVSNASNSTSISLSGTGVMLAGTLSLSPSSLNFGNVIVQTTSALPPFVQNTGTASVTISSSKVSGTGFSVSGLALPMILSPGQSTSFSVNFSPTTTGSVTGQVTLTSNASNSPSTLSLAGWGVNSHYVTLNWVPGASTGIIGYNVYRGTQSGGPYVKTNAALLSAKSYTDTTVLAGQTYYYVATEVNSSNVESAYSNQATTVVPFP
jgi:hypothetical protein